MGITGSGFVWHMYHNQLLSYCCNYDYRVNGIMRCKPSNEIPIRLKRFQFVKGELPAAFDGPMDNSRVSHLMSEHQEEIDALHKKECKNCSWDGRQLLFHKPHWLQRVWIWLRVRWAHRHECHWPNWSHKWPWNDV